MKKPRIKLKKKVPDPKSDIIRWRKDGGNVALELQAYKMGIQQQVMGTLLDAAPKAMKTIEELSDTSEKDAVRLKAAQDILDRVGLIPTTKSEITHRKKDILDDMTDEELAELAQSYFGTKAEVVIEVNEQDTSHSKKEK